MDVDHISLVTTPVVLNKGAAQVSQGTGFYFILQEPAKKLSVVFLVTNYHVLTGFAPAEKKSPIGDSITFYCHKDESKLANVKAIRLPLFTTQGQPIWLISKDHPDADVAIIPLPSAVLSDCKVFGISEEWAGGGIRVRPTSAITLVGYPYGFFDSANFLPVYKTGNVASEPTLDFDGKPLFVVDISAFPGMSGSPAFAIAYGTYEAEQGGTVVGSARKFLGIYASMQMLQEKKFLEQLDASPKKPGMVLSQSLELGHIWKAKLILDMVKHIDIPKYEKEILQYLQ